MQLTSHHKRIEQNLAIGDIIHELLFKEDAVGTNRNHDVSEQSVKVNFKERHLMKLLNLMRIIMYLSLV